MRQARTAGHAVAWGLAILSALGCGSASPIDLGTEYLVDPPPEDELPTEPELPVGPRPPHQACLAPFTACGGLLAGSWEVEDTGTCYGTTQSPKALQIWGQTFMNLDGMACWDAVWKVESKFTGHLRFENDRAIDDRLRTDTLYMDLTASCLSATYGVMIREDQMGAVCDDLTNQVMSCSSMGTVCRCEGRRQTRPRNSGSYQVGEDWVWIESDGGGDWYGYCVEGDRLVWRDAGSARHIVLRRVGEATDTSDPQYPH